MTESWGNPSPALIRSKPAVMTITRTFRLLYLAQRKMNLVLVTKKSGSNVFL
ncbi:MAG: hypothetical protein LBQ66_13195 [Planctomycetaceae bacterium]|nr:hypothetical protein [Planctomycetaceae bacterium]